MNGFSLDEIIKESFKLLPERYKNILKERFGLQNGCPLSLESIGKKRKITRERVRQIVNLAMKKVVIPESFIKHLDWAVNQINMWGGVESEEMFFKEAIIHYFYDKKPEKFFKEKYKFLLLSSGKIKSHNKDKNFKSFFYVSDKDLARFKRIISDFQEKLDKKNGIFKTEEFYQAIKSISFKTKLNESIICSYLALKNDIETNILDEVGLNTLKRIKPRNIKDQLHLIFQKVARPIHFSEAVKIIEANNYWKRPLNIHTVHNELIRDSRFVLIGRGIYALKEWGYEGGTVKQVLEKILSKAKKPLSLKEILAAVNKELIVKEETVKFNLKKYPQFRLLDNGKYILESKLKVLEA